MTAKTLINAPADGVNKHHLKRIFIQTKRMIYSTGMHHITDNSPFNQIWKCKQLIFSQTFQTIY